MRGVFRARRCLLVMFYFVLSAPLAPALCPRLSNCHPVIPTQLPTQFITIRTLLKSSESNDDNVNINNDFFEQTAQDGAKEVATMSIQERTKRAMLAEACEDRIMQHYDVLEELLGKDGLLQSKENRNEVEVLAREIKSLRQEYGALVSGRTSPMLDSIDGTSSGDGGEN